MKTAKKKKRRSAVQRLMNALDRMIVAAKQAEKAKADLLREQKGGSKK